jgi:hypothetical protein
LAEKYKLISSLTISQISYYQKQHKLLSTIIMYLSTNESQAAPTTTKKSNCKGNFFNSWLNKNTTAMEQADPVDTVDMYAPLKDHDDVLSLDGFTEASSYQTILIWSCGNSIGSSSASEDQDYEDGEAESDDPNELEGVYFALDTDQERRLHLETIEDDEDDEEWSLSLRYDKEEYMARPEKVPGHSRMPRRGSNESYDSFVFSSCPRLKRRT